MKLNRSEDYPKQGSYFNRRVRVMFGYREPVFMGQVVRDDTTEPGLLIIKLDDNRYVLATECQWSPMPGQT